MIVRPPFWRGHASMPRFFLHIDDGREVILDEEGSAQPDYAAARQEAIDTAIEMWGDLMRSGRDPRGYSFRIHDNEGKIQGTVGFMEALDGLKG
jgi:hypothetical protein